MNKANKGRSCSCHSDSTQNTQNLQRATPTYRGESLSTWEHRLNDLCADERLQALDAVECFTKLSPHSLNFSLMVRLLRDEDPRVRNRAASVLVSFPDLALSYRYAFESACHDKLLNDEVAEKVQSVVRAAFEPPHKAPQPSDSRFGWVEVVILLAEAVVSWAAQRYLTQLFGSGANMPDLSVAAAYDARSILNAALDENTLRTYQANTASLADDFKTYLSTEPKQVSLLGLVLSKSSTVVRGSQSLGLSGIGCFSISANLRLLALQDLVRFFGGSIDNLRAEKTDYLNWLNGQFVPLQAQFDSRFAHPGMPCSEIGGDGQFGGNCSTFWTLDGQRQYVYASGDACRIFSLPGQVGSFCKPLFSLPPIDCIDVQCYNNMTKRRAELQGVLNNRLAALTDVLNKWRAMPEGPP